MPLHLTLAHCVRVCARSTNGDGKIQLEEFEANMKPRTREKIEELLNAGWKFDATLWAESQERHAHWDMSKVYKQFGARQGRGSNARLARPHAR